MNDKEYYTKTDLKKLGFSEAMINKVFPNPIIKTNPYYKCARPMKLYESNMVDEYINTIDFQIYLEKRKTKSEKVKEIVLSKKQKLIQEINEKINEIKVKKIDIKELEQRTLLSKCNWLFNNENYNFDPFNIKEETLKRWMINYIRHELTDYDELLYTIKGKIGKQNAYEIYRKAVMDKIKEIYPELFI